MKLLRCTLAELGATAIAVLISIGSDLDTFTAASILVNPELY
jgi:hypothetical protein